MQATTIICPDRLQTSRGLATALAPAADGSPAQADCCMNRPDAQLQRAPTDAPLNSVCGDMTGQNSAAASSANFWKSLSVVATVGGYAVDACKARTTCKLAFGDDDLLAAADKAARQAMLPRKQRTPLMHAAHIGNAARIQQYMDMGGAAD